MDMEICPCGSGSAYGDCCRPFIKGDATPSTAEQLMRSRYSAYVMVEADYLFATTHPEYRKGYDHKGTRVWAENAQWDGLEILDRLDGGEGDARGQVEFVARYREKGLKREHHELANFKREGEGWFFTEGTAVAPRPIVRSGPKVGRNDPCPCGSGRKFKKCCGG